MITESHHEGIDLIERIRQQDERALTELYERYGQRVYNMAMHVVRNAAAAEEITQDIFFELWRKPDSWDPAKGRLLSWLLVVTRYRAIDRLRKEQSRPSVNVVALDDLAHMLGSRETVGDSQRDNGELLRKLLKELPGDQRQVINLAFFQGMTHSEIAEHLNLPLGTVKGRIRLGLEKLKEGWLLATR